MQNIYKIWTVSKVLCVQNETTECANSPDYVVGPMIMKRGRFPKSFLRKTTILVGKIQVLWQTARERNMMVYCPQS